MKKLLCLLAVAICLLTLSGCEKDENGSKATPSVVPTVTPSPTPAPQMAKVAQIKGADDGLNIRKAASSDGEILGQGENGDKFLLLVEKPKDGWYQIQYEGGIAYISADYAEVKDVTLEEANRLKGNSDNSSDSSASEPSSSSEDSSEPDSQEPSASSEAPESGTVASKLNSEDGES